MMWKTYKREIMEREQVQKDFLKKYYHQTHHKHTKKPSSNSLPASEGNQDLLEGLENKPIEVNGTGSPEVFEEDDDWPVQVRGNNF